MATVWKQDGFRFYVYSNDHRPSHVHMKKAGGEAVIFLGNKNTKPSLRELRGMNPKDVRRALEITAQRQEQLEASWRDIHG